jgi:16S rRNA (cytosine967-C5)-methyltransferase
VRAELPHWLFRAIEQQYSDAAALIATLTESAPLDLRVNLMKATRDAVAGGTPRPPRSGRSHALFARGDPACDQAGADAVAGVSRGPHRGAGRGQPADRATGPPRRGEMVVDFCAGAGGKTLALGALMRSTGRLYAFDINQPPARG